ncbi:MAG: hypothetical protein ACLGHG_05035 [Gammaproteobacteria bacterium]
MARLLTALTLVLAAAGALAGTAPAPVTDEEFSTLVHAVERDPGALNRHRNILERLSAEQMSLAITGTGNSHFTWLYPMVLRAQDYPELAGTPIGQLSLVAVRGGKIVPIPFQIDEFDTRGLIYIPGVATPGPLNPGLIKRQRDTDGVAGVYDQSDELVFMFRDGGTRPATPDELKATKGSVLATVRLTREGLPARYVHVMKGHPQRSNADYVKVDLGHGKVQTSVADIEWDPSSMALIKRIAPRVGPSSGQNIIDSVYGEVSTGVLQKDLRFSLNTTNNIRIQPVAVRDGPVRAVLLVKIRIFYMGLPVFHDFINVAMYEQGASLLARLRLDSLDAAKYFINLIKEPRIEASIDFAGMEGAEVRWQAYEGSPERAIVDGHMSPVENMMNNTRLPGDWLWMDSKRGWQFFFSNNFSVEPDGLMQAFLEGMTIKMIYEDDPNATRKGERIPGAGPRFGINTSGMPHIVTSLLTTFRGIDLSKLSGIEDLIDQMIVLEEKGKLDRLNQNINLIHHRLLREGKLENLEDIARLQVRDIERLGFRPDDKKKLARLAYRAILEGGDLEDYKLGNVLKAMKRIAQEEGFDFEKLQYAMLDNTLWFPDQVGPAGPAGFDREVRNPPVATIIGR